MDKLRELVRNRIKRFNWRNYKGSLRDPFFYLKATAIVLFSFTALLNPTTDISTPFFIESPQNSEGVFLAPGTIVKESPELSFIQKNSLAAISPPIIVTPQVLGALAGGEDYGEVQKEIIEYIVQPGDNISSIAGKFNISTETLLWANDLNKNALLQIGQKLVVLPVSGLIHHVKKGETLSEIVQLYKTDSGAIIAFNDLSIDGDIYVGDVLVIPNGVMPPLAKYVQPSLIPLGSSYFIYPLSQPFRITQGLHWYNAIDFSNNKCGTPIFSAAAGEVLKVRLTNSTSRWAFGGAGNHLTILHPNGVVTFYGHIKTSLVNPGDSVSQGQIIATVGGFPGTPGAGNSTGCHVHFGVQGARNPFAE